MQCADYLAIAESQHTRRWEAMRRVIEDAGKQYASMRIDVIEERLQEEAAPFWFSVALTLFVAVVPMANLTERFFGRLTGATTKLLTDGSRGSLVQVGVMIEQE